MVVTSETDSKTWKSLVMCLLELPDVASFHVTRWYTVYLLSFKCMSLYNLRTVSRKKQRRTVKVNMITFIKWVGPTVWAYILYKLYNKSNIFKDVIHAVIGYLYYSEILGSLILHQKSNRKQSSFTKIIPVISNTKRPTEKQFMAIGKYVVFCGDIISCLKSFWMFFLVSNAFPWELEGFLTRKNLVDPSHQSNLTHWPWRTKAHEKEHDILDLPPTQDSSGKWRFSLGFPTKNGS